MKISEALAEIVLQDADNKSVRLADLWHDKALVLVFLRHFG